MQMCAVISIWYSIEMAFLKRCMVQSLRLQLSFMIFFLFSWGTKKKKNELTHRFGCMQKVLFCDNRVSFELYIRRINREETKEKKTGFQLNNNTRTRYVIIQFTNMTYYVRYICEQINGIVYPLFFQTFQTWTFLIDRSLHVIRVQCWRKQKKTAKTKIWPEVGKWWI